VTRRKPPATVSAHGSLSQLSSAQRDEHMIVSRQCRFPHSDANNHTGPPIFNFLSMPPHPSTADPILRDKAHLVAWRVWV
jgi:hypothetical protein